MSPQISVNIITHNRAHLIGRAIQSVLDQSLTEWEAIIIDDESADSTAAVVESFNDRRLKYYRITRQTSIGAARNIGLNLSQGRYVAVLDDDDFWIDPDKLKKQKEFLETGGYSLVGTAVNLVDVNGKLSGGESYLLGHDEIKKKLTAQNQFAHSTVLFLKEAALLVGGYDNLNLAEDYSLWLKLGINGRLANLPNSTTNYTINHSTYQHRPQAMINQVYAVVKNYLKFYPHHYRHRLKWQYRKLKAKIYD